VIKNRYGDPLAIKRDMGKGMALAVSEVFTNKPDLDLKIIKYLMTYLNNSIIN